MESEFKVHRAQAEVLLSEALYNVVISGRRFGKSTLQLIKLYQKLTQPLERVAGSIRPTVLGIAPTHPQARSILFNPFLQLLADCVGDSFVNSDYVNRTLMTVDLGSNYPLLRFSGAHGTAQERLRGLKLLHCGVDETQDVSLGFLRKVIFPALADLGGSAIFTGTPKSKQDTLYQLSHAGNIDTRTFSYSSYANTLIPDWHEKLDKLALMLPSADFQQEILAQFVSKNGAYYSEYDGAYVLTSPQDAREMLGQVVDWIVGFDPGSLNRGWVIIGRYMLSNVQHFILCHAEIQSQHGLDSEALNYVLAQVQKMNSVLGRNIPIKMVAIDPSRPELVKELRSQHVNALKAENAFEAGVSVANTLFRQYRIRMLTHSLFDGESLQWFADQLEGYHRQIAPDGNVIDKEDSDIPTHTLDGFRYAYSTLNRHSKDLLGLSSVLPTRTKVQASSYFT